MNRPLREHFEVSTDLGEALRTFDYIEELEKYIDHLEALRQPAVIKSVCPHCNHINVGTFENLNHCFVCEHEWQTVLELINDNQKTAEQIFEKHWKLRTGKELDDTTKQHMSYCIDAINEALTLK